MTEQTPAEVAAATAEHATASPEATSPNADLVGGTTTDAPALLSNGPTVAELEAELAALKAKQAPHDPMAIPHAHYVLPVSPAPTPAKVVTPSAQLAEKLAALPPGHKPVKKQYKYKRNR